MKNILERDKKTRQFVETLYARGDAEREIKRIWQGRIKVCLGLLAASGILFLLCFLQQPEKTALHNDNILIRPAEDAVVPVLVSGERDGKAWEKEMNLKVKDRDYTEAEKQELERIVTRFLEEDLRGENASLAEVSKAVSFAETVPQTEVELRWSYDTEYFRESGVPIAKNIPASGVDTEVRAKAVCRNWKKTFFFTLHLVPKEYSAEELEIQKVRQAIRKALKKQATESEVALPGEVGDTRVSYRVEEAEKNYFPVYLCLLALCMLPLLWDRQQKRRLAEREEQLLVDHPGIVNKFMLLLSAGLTVRLAVERLAVEYEAERKKGGRIRYVYEEICVMNQEMRDGISEGKAMERFGRRCRLLPYLRFTSVITQNLRKGAEGVLDILEKESLEALEQRKERAMQMGEKAGTKLLFPMILMLGLVMGIIMIPAFMTM